MSASASSSFDTGFNPRSLHRERQHTVMIDYNPFGVSIHAPYIGSDFKCAAVQSQRECFNPRSLHRERHDGLAIIDYCFRFQSTLPT